MTKHKESPADTPAWLRPSMPSTARPSKWREGPGVVVATFKVPVCLDNAALNVYPEHNHGSVCWWDGHPFDNPPVGCPVSHDELHNEFSLQGFFCSWACARAYGNIHTYGTTRMMVPSYIRMIMQRLQQQQQHKQASNNSSTSSSEVSNNSSTPNKNKQSPVIDAPDAAPHWCILQRFGGKLTIDEYRSLPQIRTSTGVTLTVSPEQSRLYMAGYDCFLEDPRIQVPQFSAIEQRLVQVDHDKCYVFPKQTRRADQHLPRSKKPAAAQTPTTEADWLPKPTDKVLMPFGHKNKRNNKLKRINQPDQPNQSDQSDQSDQPKQQPNSTADTSELTKPVPTAASRKRASKREMNRCIKTTKALRRSLNEAAPEALYRQYRMVNPVVRCMNIQIKKKS